MRLQLHYYQHLQMRLLRALPRRLQIFLLRLLGHSLRLQGRRHLFRHSLRLLGQRHPPLSSASASPLSSASGSAAPVSPLSSASASPLYSASGSAAPVSPLSSASASP